jgi:hypothetical protein
MPKYSPSPFLTIGKDLPKGATVLERFRGINDAQETALVQRTASGDYAQFDNPRHPKSHGWWAFPLNTFRELPK